MGVLAVLQLHVIRTFFTARICCTPVSENRRFTGTGRTDVSIGSCWWATVCDDSPLLPTSALIDYLNRTASSKWMFILLLLPLSSSLHSQMLLPTQTLSMSFGSETLTKEMLCHLFLARLSLRDWQSQSASIVFLLRIPLITCPTVSMTMMLLGRRCIQMRLQTKAIAHQNVWAQVKEKVCPKIATKRQRGGEGQIYGD